MCVVFSHFDRIVAREGNRSVVLECGAGGNCQPSGISVWFTGTPDYSVAFRRVGARAVYYHYITEKNRLWLWFLRERIENPHLFLLLNTRFSNTNLHGCVSEAS